MWYAPFSFSAAESLKDHLREPLMEFGDVLLAVAAKELDIAKRLGILAFNSETAIAVLDIMRRGDDIVGDFKKIRFVAAVRTFEQVCDGRWIK